LGEAQGARRRFSARRQPWSEATITMTRRTRHSLWLAGLLPLATLAAQQSSDTARYVVLFSGRPAGSYVEWSSGDTLHSLYEYNDRGRGPRLAATIRLDAAGVPGDLTVIGHSYLKDTVDERLRMVNGARTWQSTIEDGRRPGPGRAFYLTFSETPAEIRVLVRAALAASGRLPLLPSGEATVERAGDTTIQVVGKSVHLIQYDISGLGFSPSPVWLDETDQRFAIVSAWTSVVPAGWEAAVPRLLEAQERAREARFERLAQELGHRPTGPLVIRRARLFVAESATVRPRTTVVVIGSRITDVGPDESVRAPAGAQVIDAAGKLLLPGLWDMHVHIAPGEDGLLHIAAGVTSARDLGNDTVITPRLQRRIAADSLIGPRLSLAGLIDGSGPYQVPIGVLADDSAAARHAVDWYAAHGYEQIKIYSSLKPELVPVVIAAAHSKGLRVSGHVPAFMRAEEVVRLGFDEIQHANMLMLNFMDSVRDTRSMARFTAVAQHAAELDFGSARVRRFLGLLQARRTVIDPTLDIFEDLFTARPGRVAPSEVAIASRVPPQVRRSFLTGGLPVPPGMESRYRASFDALLTLVRTLYQTGVPLVAGTDAGPVGFALQHELELYARAGIPAPRVLQLATLGAARVMHHEDERGSVAAGKLADLVLVDGDPTRRIGDLRRTVLVVKNGVMYRPDELYHALGVAPVADSSGQR
jgi:imidazolonepropionase-like amidohydrolase